ncbi:MAG: peptidoglycan-binding protein, partial [Bacteroidetes bacterium]|nr:peptidoglycan-binding protein [Bacteroidota bacterium]
MKPISKQFNPKNKRSVRNLHKVLSYLTGEDVYKEDRLLKKIGPKTKSFIKDLTGQNIGKDNGLTDNVIDQLNEALVAKKYQQPLQIEQLHNRMALLKKKKFLKLETDINQKERENKEIGASTTEYIKAFQSKYKLPETGKLDAETDARIESVITSIAGSKPQPKKKLKVKNPASLKRTVRFLRLNMRGDKVAELQNGLAFLGYIIHEEEHKSQAYGKTTRDAVVAFQTANHLPLTGEVDSKTSRLINKKLSSSNPTVNRGNTFRVRGSVRDELWKGKTEVKVSVYELGLRGKHKLLGERKTFKNGFYDILYSPPMDSVNKRPKSPLHLVVSIEKRNGEVLETKTYYNVKKVHWANFTEGEDRYQGTSRFEATNKALEKLLKANDLNIAELEQSERNQDIFHLAKETGVLPEDILKLSLSYRIALNIGQVRELPPAVFYSFLHQNLPPEMPSDLFPDEPSEWEQWIPRLVNTLTNGIIFLDEEVQKNAINNAFQGNLLPRSLKPRQKELIKSLADQQNTFILEKPILIGDGNLKSLLEISNFPAGKYTAISTAFKQHQGINTAFWESLENEPDIQDFKITTELGVIARNHTETVQSLKNLVDSSNDYDYHSAKDFAKLDRKSWEGLIEKNGNIIPDNIDGDNLEERRSIWAETLRSQAEKIYPAVNFAAELTRNQFADFTYQDEVANFIFDSEDFDLGVDDLIKYNSQTGNPLNAEALNEAKVIQRIHMLTPSTSSGIALLNQRLHSSVQIYFRGKDRFIQDLEAGNVGRIEAEHIFARAEQQYARILARITRFRFTFHRFGPRFTPKFYYDSEEIDDFKESIPNIETLFGSLDYCECKHCKSVYSPAAYLADLFRFLDEKYAVTPGQTVQDVLFDRRPDMANIKLNCENTNTPLPYIDLVNEILENALNISGETPTINRAFEHQTTLTAAELRAIPQYIRPAAYDYLKDSLYPMNMGFNLWQEESRLFLNHLGVPRYKLMQAFQGQSGLAPISPTDADTAAEYFGISTQEQAIILSPEANVIQQNRFWGFNTNVSTIDVAGFLNPSKITYQELLALLQVQIINPETNQTVILRPVDTCDISVQTINNLTLAKFDQFHRFLRLWRRTEWKMWELDLLIENALIGNEAIDEPALVNLMHVRLMQKKLGISVEDFLSFFAPLNTRIRISPDDSEQLIYPLYHRIFQNITITNPL